MYVPQVGDKLKTMGGMDAQIMGIFPDQERCLLVAAKARAKGTIYCYMAFADGTTHALVGVHHQIIITAHEDLVFPVEEADII